MSSISERVAFAIASSSKWSGQSYESDKMQSISTRAENMLREVGSYGSYIVEGDPQMWGNGEALATIYMEPKGGTGDCMLPIDYYGSGFSVAVRASERLKGYHIEFINAAVACVFSED